MTPTRSTQICAIRVCLFILTLACTLLTAGTHPIFNGQTRVGFTVGDQWEPSIAAEAVEHWRGQRPELRHAGEGQLGPGNGRNVHVEVQGLRPARARVPRSIEDVDLAV